jgi:MFS transporter, putative metabolite:H+ symporter
MIELLERQKKLTANQWKLICTANVADLLDFFDFFLIGYVTAALTKEWSLPYWQGGAILLASGLGAVPGAFIWGWLGDRIGRRTVFIWSAVTISLATGIMVFTPGPSAVIPGWLFLMFFRVFVGIGNAGIFTIDLPLVQEFIPAYKRGWVSALVTTLLPGGGMLAGFATSSIGGGAIDGGIGITRCRLISQAFAEGFVGTGLCGIGFKATPRIAAGSTPQ